MIHSLVKALVLIVAAVWAGPARADRYWDVPESDAAAIASELKRGAIVVTWCEQCDGDLRILRVRSASVAPGTYDDERRSLLLEREVLFAGSSKSALELKKTAVCGAAEPDWADPGTPDSPPGMTEHLDIPYSYLLEQDGSLRWLGASVGGLFGYSGRPVPPPAATFVVRVRACAKDGAAGRLNAQLREAAGKPALPSTTPRVELRREGELWKYTIVSPGKLPVIMFIVDADAKVAVAASPKGWKADTTGCLHVTWQSTGTDASKPAPQDAASGASLGGFALRSKAKNATRGTYHLGFWDSAGKKQVVVNGDIDVPSLPGDCPAD